jgi:protein-L-isoaspartate(D-aspartate) O-methyltransferase
MVHEKHLKNMINRLREMGIHDRSVLKAMQRVPRHRFISDALSFQAYDEKALPIGKGQTISHPYTVAKMTELISIKEGHKILEIGTGSGYQTAVLAELKAQVFTVEIHKSLSDKAKELIIDLGYHVACRVGDGRKGWPNFAPYHAIIVTAGTPALPEELVKQLYVGGKLIIPIGKRSKQQLTIFVKKEQGTEKQVLEEFKFVPLL